MKITVAQPAIKRALMLAAIGAGRHEAEAGKNVSVAAKALQDALAAIRFDANDDGLAVSCFDRKTSIRARVDATISEGGSFATSAAKVLALIAAFPDSASISITDSGGVTAGTSRYRLIPIAVDSLPPRFEFDGEAATAAIDASAMARLFEPAPAANHEKSRGYLNGVNWRSVGPMLVAVATNGGELIRTEIEAPSFTSSNKLIVPTASVTILKKLAALTKPAGLTLRYNGRLLLAGCSAFEFMTTLVGGEYPEVDRVLPKPAATVVCDRRDLAAALQRMAAAANSAAPLLAAVFADGALKLFLAREPTIGADVLAAKTNGSGRFAAPLPQFIRMIGEIEGAELEIGTDKNIGIRSPGDSGKLGMIANTTVAPAIWEHAP